MDNVRKKQVVDEYIKATQEARDIFISIRSKREQSFNTWYASLQKSLSANPELAEKIPFSIEGWSVKTLVPEWYETNPDQAKADEQWKAAADKIDQINDIFYQYILEGMEIQRRYKELDSGAHL